MAPFCSSIWPSAVSVCLFPKCFHRAFSLPHFICPFCSRKKSIRDEIAFFFLRSTLICKFKVKNLQRNRAEKCADGVKHTNCVWFVIFHHPMQPPQPPQPHPQPPPSTAFSRSLFIIPFAAPFASVGKEKGFYTTVTVLTSRLGQWMFRLAVGLIYTVLQILTVMDEYKGSVFSGNYVILGPDENWRTKSFSLSLFIPLTVESITVAGCDGVANLEQDNCTGMRESLTKGVVFSLSSAVLYH